MKKAIAIIEQHPKLVEIEEGYNAYRQELEDKMKFIRKQADDLNKSFADALKKADEKRAGFCKEMGILPVEYDPTTFHFHNTKGALVVCDEKIEGGLDGLMAALLGGGK